MSRDLEGRVLVITGASSGIGEATAHLAAAAGMKVVLAARRHENLERTAEDIRAAGGEALPVPADVALQKDNLRLIERTLDAYGRLDAFFANAGFGFRQEMAGEEHESEQAIWQVNYFGTVYGVRAAARTMREAGGGHILICSSIVGRIGLPYHGSYSATKAAQHAMGQALALELAPAGIDVSIVYPVGTDTEFTAVAAQHSRSDMARGNTPRNLRQSPEHVARRVVACLKRPRPEVWPSRLGHLGAALVALCPRLHRPMFRKQAAGVRALLERDAGG